MTSTAPIYHSDDNTKPHHGAAIQLIIIILAALRQIVANAKSGILQPPFFTDPLYSIKLPAVQALYPEHFKFLDEDVAYRITGGAVGTALGRYNFLLELAAKYKKIVPQDFSHFPRSTSMEPSSSPSYACVLLRVSTTTSPNLHLLRLAKNSRPLTGHRHPGRGFYRPSRLHRPWQL